jgi:hypothetical protein
LKRVNTAPPHPVHLVDGCVSANHAFLLQKLSCPVSGDEQHGLMFRIAVRLESLGG